MAIQLTEGTGGNNSFSFSEQKAAARNISYLNTDNDPGVDYQPNITQEALNDIAFITARLFGGPIMMRDEVDPLIQGKGENGGTYSIGRTAAQTIAVNPTIVSIAPGKAVFLPFSSGLGKFALVGDMLNPLSGLNGAITSSAAKTLKKNRMFYTISSAYQDYMNHVNMIARMMAIYIGIGDVLVPYSSTPFKEYNWAHWYDKEDPASQSGTMQGKSSTDEDISWTDDENSSITGDARAIFSYYGNDPEDTIFGPNVYVHFYANSNSSYDESTSTSTRQSSLQSSFEGVFSDTVRDIQFLFGGAASESGIIEDINALFSGLADSMGGIGELAKAATNYLKGGRLVFPQMVDQTTYSKSISLGMRFSSPYGDPLSVFLYCLLPLAHIMAFSFPKQIDNNMFTYPFLVSVYSKGFINCDMGVVSSIRVARGGQDDSSWSASGLATDIEVNLEIQPLHSEMMISSARHPFLFLQNYALQEYLGTICGVDTKGDSVMMQINTITTLFGNAVRDTFNLENIARSLQDWVLGTKLGQAYQVAMKFLTLP